MKNSHFTGKLLPILFIAFLSLSIASKAQSRINGSVKGILVDSKTRLPLEAAAITIKNAEAFVVQSTATRKDGTFLINNLSAGQYELWISFVGYATLKKPFTIGEKKVSDDLGIILLEQGINLIEVFVEGEAAPVIMKKDTMEYNASSFKTQANDNTEELLRKLPGVEVDKDGKITVHGKTVSKIVVDGNDFFGGDPKAATRNLPADAISKVQLINDKTEQAKNTGIDNGQREKVINLTIKEDKKKGWFGNTAIAGGSAERYLGQVNMNRFNKNKQVSFLFMSNNVNQSGFSLEDLNNFSGGDVSSTFSVGDGSSMSVSRSRNGSADVNGIFSGVGNGGLINTHSGGINFSNTYGKRKQLKLNSSYVTISSSNTIFKWSDIQDPLANELVYTSLSAYGENKSDIHRANLNITYKVDSLTTIRFKPNFSLSVRKNLNDQNYESINQSSSPVNSGNQYFDQSTTSPSFGGLLSINKLISKSRGSINFFTSGNYNSSKLNYINRSLTKFTVSGTEQQNAFNQQSEQKNDRSYISSTLSYVSTISKSKGLSLFTQNNFQYSDDLADQVTLEYNPANGAYEILVPALSNNFDNKSWRNTTTIGLNISKEKLNYELNAAVAYLGLSGEIAENPAADVRKNSLAFIPGINVHYHGKNDVNISAGIGSNVNMPSVVNLQPVYNNTNPLYIRRGNPDLGISRSMNAYANYESFNSRTNQSIEVSSSFNQVWNAFSTESTVDADSRIQTVKPINVDGNYNLDLEISTGKPTKIKGLKVRYQTNSNLNRNVSFINGSRNKSDRIAVGLNAGLNYSKGTFSINFDQLLSYNKVNNSFQSLSNQTYYRFNTDFRISAEPVKSLRVYSDLSLNKYSGANSNSLKNNILLMNAGIEKFFMKTRQLSLALTGFDLLNQNSNIQRSVSATGRIEDFRTNNLNRYMYLKLNYKLQRAAAPKE